MKASLPTDVRNPHSGSQVVEMTDAMLASVVFDEACLAAGLSNKEIAITVGVASDSLVTRWRSPEHPALPSLSHLHKLGPDFMRLWVRGYSRRYGWGRRALLDLVTAVGECVEEIAG